MPTGGATAAPSPVSFAFASDEAGGQPRQRQFGGGRSARSRAPRSCTNGAIVSEGVPGAASARPRSGTPPPRSLLAPTQINVSARGDDEVHPLAMAPMSGANNLAGSAPVGVGSAGVGKLGMGRVVRQSLHQKQESGMSKEGSLEMSDMTSSSSSNNNVRKSCPPVKRHNDAGKLNPIQQAAMDNFIKAQQSGNPAAKEEMWKELVRAMKPDDSNSVGYGRQNSSGGGRNRRGGSRCSGRSWSSSKDDVLGLIRIGGGLKIGAAADAVSIESGLTSEYDTGKSSKSALSAKSEGWTRGQWNPSPQNSPVKGPWNPGPGSSQGSPAKGNLGSSQGSPTRGREVLKKNEMDSRPDQAKKRANQIQTSSAGSGASRGEGVTNEGARAVTPPNVPMMSNISAGGKPVVSPLSDDGSFEQEDNPVDGEDLGFANFGDLDDDLGTESKAKRGDAKSGKQSQNKKKDVFFDIGQSFGDNTRHLWNDPGLQKTDDTRAFGDNGQAFGNVQKKKTDDDHAFGDVKQLWNDPNAKKTGDPTLSLADLSDGETLSTYKNGQDLPPMLPGPRSESVVRNVTGVWRGDDANSSFREARAREQMMAAQSARLQRERDSMFGNPGGGRKARTSPNTSLFMSNEGEVMEVTSSFKETGQQSREKESEAAKLDAVFGTDSKLDAVFGTAFADQELPDAASQQLQPAGDAVFGAYDAGPRKQQQQTEDEPNRQLRQEAILGAFPESPKRQAQTKMAQQQSQPLGQEPQQEALLGVFPESLKRPAQTKMTEQQQQPQSQEEVPGAFPVSPKKQGQSAPTQPQSSSHRTSKRRQRKPSAPAPSLEEQILNVLQQQPESHVVVEEEDAEAGGEEFFGRSSPIQSPPTSKNSKPPRVKGGTVGSNVSAQDILRELNSSTPSTFQSGGSLSGSNRGKNRLLPYSHSQNISKQVSSVEGRVQQHRLRLQQQNAQPTVSQASPSEDSSDRSSRGSLRSSQTPPKSLAPSKRDLLPRPNRISRRSASEPTPVATAAMVSDTARSGVNVTAEPVYKVESTVPPETQDGKADSRSVGSGSARSRESRDVSATPRRDAVVEEQPEIKVESPLERYRKCLGANGRENLAAQSSNNARLRGRIFSRTNPSAGNAGTAPLRQQLTPQHGSKNPFEDGTNPFDSPPRQPHGFEENVEDPFEAQSSPIPMEGTLDSPPRQKLPDSESGYPFKEQSSPIPVESSRDTSLSAHQISVPSLEEDSADRSSNITRDVSASSQPKNLTPLQLKLSSNQPANDMSISYSSDRAVAPPSLPTNEMLQSARPTPSASRPNTALLLPPSKRDSTPRSSPSPHSRIASSSSTARSSPSSSPKSSPRSSEIDEIRASISRLKNNGVGGVGKKTSTLVRNEETGRFVIRDMDDECFDDIIAADMMKPMVIREEEADDVVETRQGSVESDQLRLGAMAKQHHRYLPQNYAVDGRVSNAPKSPRSPMLDQIMSESVMDDDAVDDAVRAATDCLSTYSTTSSEEASIATEAAEEPSEELRQRQEPTDVTKEGDFAEDDGEDFFVIRRPKVSQGWDAQWSAFASSDRGSSYDDFDIRPSNSMDEWGGGITGSSWDCDEDPGFGGTDDDTGFGGTDDDGFGDCWGREEKKVEKGAAGFQSSPTSVATNGRKLF